MIWIIGISVIIILAVDTFLIVKKKGILAICFTSVSIMTLVLSLVLGGRARYINTINDCLADKEYKVYADGIKADRNDIDLGRYTYKIDSKRKIIMFYSK